MRPPRHGGPLAALGLLAGGLALVSVAAPSAAASGQVCMGVVVDDGNGSTAVQSAEVTPGVTTDLQAMSEAGEVPTQNDSGLVCAINLYPTNGLANCLAASGGLFYYWSYWEGDVSTNTWTYASIGPASHTVSSGQEYVEGWRYQDPGADNPNATKPSVTPAAAFAQSCGNTTTTTSTTSGGGSLGGSSTTTSTTPSTSVSPPASASVPATPGPATRASTHTSPTSTTSTTLYSKGKATTSPTTTVPGASTTSTTADAGGRSSGGRSESTKLAAADTSAHSTSGGDPAWPIVLIVAVIALLGGLAWFRWRRRPAEE